MAVAGRTGLVPRGAPLHHRFPLLIAWAGMTLGYGLLQSLSAAVFGVRPGAAALGTDLLAHLLLGTLLLAMARGLGRFLLAWLALTAAFTLVNAAKVAILGAPVMPDDFLAARHLFRWLSGWQWLAALVTLALPLTLLGWMFAWRRPRAWASLGLLATLAVGLLLFPETASRALDARFGDWGWNQRGNFEARGLPLHLVQEGVRSRARREPIPDPAAVAQALRNLGSQPRSGLIAVEGATPPRRNLHLIVLESFWDPLELTAAGIAEDPLDPAFRALWADAGYSHALSPVFGGYTANAEFEALCGFPVERDHVFFEGGLRREAPCLPRHLAAAGYRAIASHPNVAAFWNRVNAYRRVGFSTYWSEQDFDLDDLSDGLLSDASLYRQVLDKLDPYLQDPDPVFNYVLTYFGHLPYPRNLLRPERIAVAADPGLIAAYANSLYYKSRELMAFLAALRARDPRAVVVLFGDHLPYLGPNYRGYTDSGLLAAARSDFSDAMFRTLVATPLVVIDGERGVVNTGDLPLYQLPGLLLSLLGDHRPSILGLTWPDLAADLGTVRLRPLPGLHMLRLEDAVIACRGAGAPHPACAATAERLEALRTLSRDLFAGEQHALHDLEEPPGPQAVEAFGAEAPDAT